MLERNKLMVKYNECSEHTLKVFFNIIESVWCGILFCLLCENDDELFVNTKPVFDKSLMVYRMLEIGFSTKYALKRPLWDILEQKLLYSSFCETFLNKSFFLATSIRLFTTYQCKSVDDYHITY